MKITDPLILPKDVILCQVSSLPEVQRCLLEADDDDYVLTRKRGRSRSKVIDSEMAELVAEFRTGKTIVDAVLNFSRENEHNPEDTLEAAYPILEKLIDGNFLAADGSGEAEAVEASLENGQQWAGLEIIRSVQILEDTEIYQAKDKHGKIVALKVARSGAAKHLRGTFYRERKILEHLGGKNFPRLLTHGDIEGRPFLAMTWCDGVNGMRAAARYRSIYGKEGRQRLLNICCVIADAYCALHKQDIIHGDVHPGNMIIDDNDNVTIIDFGFARLMSSDDSSLTLARRGGLGYFFDPEYAECFLNGVQTIPPADTKSEQHILAHVLYRLISGHDYTDFSTERKESMRQLAESKPEPFSRWDCDPWPDVEAVLQRALSPDPVNRFGSVEEMAEALRGASIPEPPRRALKKPYLVREPLSDLFLVDYLRRFNPAGSLFDVGLPDPPYSSITFGSAGVAYFLYRLACIREDAELLSWSKLWVEKAISEGQSKGELAFTTTEEGRVTRDIIGRISLYHTETGLFVTKALIGHAMGDIPSLTNGIVSFVESAQRPCDNIDVTLGSSGILLACALLNEAMPDFESIRRLGDSVMEEIWGKVAEMPLLQDEQEVRLTGIAHGWSGVLYAVLMWCKSSGATLPPGIIDRLDQLADLSEPANYGLRWQRKIRPPEHRDPSDFNLSWCNGTGGIIFLWTLAHGMIEKKRFLEMAEGAAKNVVGGSDRINQICCGRPGQAYGVLNLYKHTRDDCWLRYAQEMANLIMRSNTPPTGQNTPLYYHSLYKGPMGLALLSADMEKPEGACMPLFESEQWIA